MVSLSHWTYYEAVVSQATYPLHLSKISVLPWIVCVLVPVVGVYLVLQSYHRLTGPDLQRLDAVSRSPLQAQLAEGKHLCLRLHSPMTVALC